MAKELIDILTRAAEVRDETGAAENTASKVGGILTDLIDLIGESILSAGLSFNVSANGITLIVKQYDDEGCAFNTEIPFSMASATNAGAITAAQLTNLTNFIMSLAIVGPNSVTLQYTKPLTGDIKSIPINGATKTLAGVMTAAQVQAQEEHAKRIMKTIGINELDTLTTIPIANTGAADYWLTHNDIIVGRLFMFEDSMFHKSTQIVICNNYVEGFPTGGHYKEGLSIYYRFYGHNSTDVPQGAWTAWKRLFDSEIPDILDMGVVSSSSVAEDRAVELARNKNILFMRYETANGQIGTIQQVYSNDGYSMQYLTLNGTEFVRVVYYDSGMKSAWRNINKTSIVYKLLYDANSRVLSFHDPIQDEGFGGVTLPLATTSKAGLMTATDKEKINNLSDKMIVDLGTVATSAVAEDYAAQSDVAGNRDILAIRYRTKVADESGTRESFILQWVRGDNKCAQLLFHNLGIYRRDVTGASGQAGQNTNAFDWEPTFVHKITYTASNRKITLKDYENNIVAEIQLPAASTSAQGMVKLGTTAGTAYDGASGKALADRITELETRLTIAENKIQAFHPY